MNGRSGRAAYRTRQAFHSLRPRLHDGHVEDAHGILSDAESALFAGMEKRDQRHAIEVMHRLRAGGVEDTDLLKAALLHDCAKGEVPFWLRVARVLAPGFVRRAGAEDAPGWRGAAYRLTHDAALSAAKAREAGSSDMTVSLIRGHVASEHADKLALLMAADDAS